MCYGRKFERKKKLNNYELFIYIEVLGASYLGAQHPYQFILEGDASRKLLEVYTYEWN